MGYARADLGQIDEAKEIVDHLKDKAPELAATLSSYIHQVDPPKMLFAYTTESSFQYYMPAKTPVSSLDAYLETAGASKNFTMKFQLIRPGKNLPAHGIIFPFKADLSQAETFRPSRWDKPKYNQNFCLTFLLKEKSAGPCPGPL